MYEVYELNFITVIRAEFDCTLSKLKNVDEPAPLRTDLSVLNIPSWPLLNELNLPAFRTITLARTSFPMPLSRPQHHTKTTAIVHTMFPGNSCPSLLTSPSRFALMPVNSSPSSYSPNPIQYLPTSRHPPPNHNNSRHRYTSLRRFS